MTPTRPSTKRIVATITTLLALNGLFIWAFFWQLGRALGGNGLSWAYVVEWPVFCCYAVWFAYCDLTGRDGRRRLPRRTCATDEDEATADDLSAYNAYLASLHDRGPTLLAGEDSNP